MNKNNLLSRKLFVFISRTKYVEIEVRAKRIIKCRFLCNVPYHELMQDLLKVHFVIKNNLTHDIIVFVSGQIKCFYFVDACGLIHYHHT